MYHHFNLALRASGQNCQFEVSLSFNSQKIPLSIEVNVLKTLELCKNIDMLNMAYLFAVIVSLTEFSVRWMPL